MQNFPTNSTLSRYFIENLIQLRGRYIFVAVYSLAGGSKYFALLEIV